MPGVSSSTSFCLQGGVDLHIAVDVQVIPGNDAVQVDHAGDIFKLIRAQVDGVIIRSFHAILLGAEGDETHGVGRLNRLQAHGQLQQDRHARGIVIRTFAAPGGIVMRTHDDLLRGEALFNSHDIGRFHLTVIVIIELERLEFHLVSIGRECIIDIFRRLSFLIAAARPGADLLADGGDMIAGDRAGIIK